MENFWNRGANFYRIQYVAVVIFGSLIAFGVFWYNVHIEKEKMRRSLLINCLMTCLFEKSNLPIVDLNKPKPEGPAKKQCLALCHKNYGELK